MEKRLLRQRSLSFKPRDMAAITANPLHDTQTKLVWDEGLLATLREDPRKGEGPHVWQVRFWCL